MKSIHHFLITLSIFLIANNFGFAQVAIEVGSTPKQTMRYGMDYERLWFWTNSLSSDEKDMVAEWSFVDNDIDFIRVAMNSGYELTEGEFNLSAYTNRIIPMMKDMQDANPDIKFFASPRPLDEAMDNVAWQPYPQWITGSSGSNSNFSFDWKKCAEYLVRYIVLMDSYGFEISYLDVTNEWNFVTPTHVRDIAEYLEEDLEEKGLLMPQIIAPSTWSYAQGRSWLNNVNTNRRRDAIDISASHNTDPGGSAEGFVERSHEILGTEKEIWNTEVHDWKSTKGFDEVLSFSFMMEAINAGFSGLTGWLAIGTTNQGHSYILNQNNTLRRNVKYFIFNKLSNTSHRGQALDIETPNELSHTTALIKDKVLTVWAVNPNDEDLDITIELTGEHTSTDKQVTMTYWNTDIDVEGIATNYTTTNPTSIGGTVPAGSLSCFEIILDEDAPEDIEVTGIDISRETISLIVDDTEQLSATINPANATNKEVKWTSSNEDVATVSETGLVTAKEEGTTTITVLSNNEDFSANSTVTVSPIPQTITPVTGIEINLKELSLEVNDEEQLGAMVIPSNATNKNITWSTSNENIATVSSTGVVSAIAEGVVSITAITEDGDFEDISVITIMNLPLGIIPVTSITLDATNLLLDINESKQLMASISPENATNQNVEWSSSNSTIAEVNSTGVVTGINAGTAEITVTVIDSEFSFTSTVIVLNENVELELLGINLISTTTELGIGDQEQMGVEFIPADVINQNVIWDTTNVSVANVDETGLVTILGDGVATISVTTEDGSFSDSRLLTIASENIEGIIVYPNPTSSEIIVNSGINSSLQIYDELGRVIMTREITTENEEINLDSFAKGIYFAQIIVDSEIYIKRIIRE